MTNGHGIETPANKIAVAQANLGIALRLNGEVEKDRITVEILKRGVTVHTGGAGVRLPPSEETDQDLKDGIYNIVLNATGASALTVDETLDDVFGKASTDKDPARLGIRVMVNQLRNAFAHNPWRPKWVNSQKYRSNYPIELDDGSQFTFDAAILHGDVKQEHVGGLEYWTKLLQHCEKLVRK